jgi:DNA-binding transcriptional MerR regulator
MSESSEHETGETYSIETVEKITRISRDRIILYYREGLISPAAPSGDQPVFDDETIHQLRRIAFLLSEYEVNHRGLKVLASLMGEVERLRQELRFLRERR